MTAVEWFHADGTPCDHGVPDDDPHGALPARCDDGHPLGYVQLAFTDTGQCT